MCGRKEKRLIAGSANDEVDKTGSKQKRTERAGGQGPVDMNSRERATDADPPDSDCLCGQTEGTDRKRESDQVPTHGGAEAGRAGGCEGVRARGCGCGCGCGCADQGLRNAAKCCENYENGGTQLQKRATGDCRYCSSC